MSKKKHGNTGSKTRNPHLESVPYATAVSRLLDALNHFNACTTDSAVTIAQLASSTGLSSNEIDNAVTDLRTREFAVMRMLSPSVSDTRFFIASQRHIIHYATNLRDQAWAYELEAERLEKMTEALQGDNIAT